MNKNAENPYNYRHHACHSCTELEGWCGKDYHRHQLARVLQLDGANALLVDSDPQGSDRDWAAMREDQPLTVVDIDRNLEQVARKDFVVIDSAPQVAGVAVSAIKAADLILIGLPRVVRTRS